MSVKSQLNDTHTSWILRAIVAFSLTLTVTTASAAVGWFLREGAYIRDRLDVVESQQRHMLSQEDARDLRSSIDEAEDKLIELERRVQTKADAAEMRQRLTGAQAEMRQRLTRTQEIINARIREIEQEVKRDE